MPLCSPYFAIGLGVGVLRLSFNFNRVIISSARPQVSSQLLAVSLLRLLLLFAALALSLDDQT